MIEGILNEGGFPALIVAMALLLKYILTICFLVFGSLAFQKYLEK